VSGWPPLLTVEQVAMLRGVSVRTVHNWLRAGLPNAGSASRPRVDGDVLDRWSPPRRGRPRRPPRL
jgi:hypothetical protein